jgi:prolyl-tRNA editing enzyme YbaK/EbsC (Cys-tRNA(Pro) deacylase)
MSASKKIVLHLGKKKVKFDVVKHKKVYTAYDLAQTLGTELDKIAKTLLVKVEFPAVQKKKPAYYAVVVPASYYVDLGKLKKTLKAAKVQMAPEKVMKKLGIEPGALSPFGSLRGLSVALDKGLLKAKEAIVGAESFTESLRMKVKDLAAMEQPVLGSFGKKNAMKLQKKPKKAKKSRVSKKKK